MSNPFMSVDVVALETVTGGTGATTHASQGSSSANQQLLTTLQGIQSSLTDLSKPQQNNNTMMFLLMAVAMSRPASSVVYVGRRGWW